jgi:hypothetical protein
MVCQMIMFDQETSCMYFKNGTLIGALCLENATLLVMSIAGIVLARC